MSSGKGGSVDAGSGGMSDKEWSGRVETNSKQADTAAYFDGEAAGWSGRYLENRHFRARLETVLGWLVKMRPGLSILDYGCGSGVLLRELAAWGFQVTGVDVSGGMPE